MQEHELREYTEAGNSPIYVRAATMLDALKAASEEGRDVTYVGLSTRGVKAQKCAPDDWGKSRAGGKRGWKAMAARTAKI